jgi:phage-related protein
MSYSSNSSFEVLLYSPDGIISPIIDYLNELSTDNPRMFKKALNNINRLPSLHATLTNIKPFKQGNFKCWELRIQSESNICRFFYQVKEPNMIIIHGFTKKTQKTDTRDINTAISNLKYYNTNPKFIKYV